MSDSADTTYRDSGIDVLKICAMLMVVCLHVLGGGGVLISVSGGKKAIAWCLEIAAFPAVDIYACITGYLMFGREFRYYKIIPRILQVLFLYFVLAFFCRFALGDAVSFSQMCRELVDALSNKYWYFTAYFGLFFFVPFLNVLVQSLDEKKLRVLLVTFFLLFGVLSLLKEFYTFGLNSGYSLLWVMVLYVFGAAVKKGCLSFSKWLCVFFILILYAVTVFSKAVCKTGRFISYLSPTVMLVAVLLLLLFRGHYIRNNMARRIISAFSDATFGVYLIHLHPLLWENYLRPLCSVLYDLSLPVFLFAVVGSVLLVFVCSALFDMVRAEVFCVLRVNAVCKHIFQGR